jgi:hypothetical protein
MSFDSFDAVFVALAFLVPGFLAHSSLTTIVGPREDASELSLVRLLTLSAINYAIWSWLIYLLYTLPTFANAPITRAVWWVIIILVSPLLLGALLGTATRRGWFAGALRWLGADARHPSPTAWDYLFGQLDEGSGVGLLVTLKDGNQVAGFYGPRSLAADRPADGDLYLERTYRVENGRWTRVETSRGIYLSGASIAHIEVFSETEQGDQSHARAQIGQPRYRSEGLPAARHDSRAPAARQPELRSSGSASVRRIERVQAVDDADADDQ